jgi:polyphosphate kinase 2 (PPK2 family)
MLEVVDLDKKLTKAAYKRLFPPLQEKLRRLQYAALQAELPTVVALEGWDTAGKGDVVRHLTQRLDPRAFRVHPGTPPSLLEQRYHFLWRYQVKLPNDGHIAVFDHSWYGRVLVERVDKLVKKSLWREAYEQINQFERWLADDGQVLVKFWLHISRKEQKRRFRACERDPALRWKITKEYWQHHRDYKKWVTAVEEVLAKTDTPHAPWTIVEATNLRWARVKVFQTIIQRIEEGLARRQANPTAVARTAAARAATKQAREQRALIDAERARVEAKEAGLPLEEPALVEAHNPSPGKSPER